MKIDKLPKLKAKLLELKAVSIRPCDTQFESNGDYDFKAYEVAYNIHWHNIGCVELAINEIETAIKIARAYRML